MANNLIKHNGDIIMYQTEDGATKVEVVFSEDIAWLMQEQIAKVFQKSKSMINEHLQNIFADEELMESEVITKLCNSEFSRQRPTQHHNFDAILAVGYRVKSQSFATKSEILKRECKIKKLTRQQKLELIGEAKE